MSQVPFDSSGVFVGTRTPTVPAAFGVCANGARAGAELTTYGSTKPSGTGAVAVTPGRFEISAAVSDSRMRRLASV